jgi:hypothetical protein
VGGFVLGSFHELFMFINHSSPPASVELIVLIPNGSTSPYGGGGGEGGGGMPPSDA